MHAPDIRACAPITAKRLHDMDSMPMDMSAARRVRELDAPGLLDTELSRTRTTGITTDTVEIIRTEPGSFYRCSTCSAGWPLRRITQSMKPPVMSITATPMPRSR